MFISFLIAVSSIVAHVKKQHVKAPSDVLDLESLCGIGNLSTVEGHAQCEDACEEAKCCMAPGSLSCFRGQEDVCSMVSTLYDCSAVQYNAVVCNIHFLQWMKLSQFCIHAQHVYIHTRTIPPPPSNSSSFYQHTVFTLCSFVFSYK